MLAVPPADSYPLAAQLLAQGRRERGSRLRQVPLPEGCDLQSQQLGCFVALDGRRTRRCQN
jgi:hypothetical protein